ncbi:SirB2 family protein [Algivirga pacifica]|uniref:Cytochrome c domain-containing protein n=1 Tax=Algivirga pacifica TaxID=1162670 RepID=A0ABP9DLE1_9BACT
MYIGFKHLHVLVVTLFLLIYLIKTVLLVLSKEKALETFTKKVKVPEMIISFLFLVTGIGMVILGAPGSKETLFIAKMVAVFASIPLAVIGFKKKNKALAVVSVILILGAYGMAEMLNSQVNAKKATVEIEDEGSLTDVMLGKSVYVQTNCVACHGENGDKGAAGAKNLKVSELSNEEIENIIRKGKGLMSGYERTLTDKQIDALKVYVKSLRD